jgi:hypothetical protein
MCQNALVLAPHSLVVDDALASKEVIKLVDFLYTCINLIKDERVV